MVATKRKIEQFQNGLLVDNVEIGFLTNRGRVRQNNEDNLYVFSPYDKDFEASGMLFAVADGMGGHAGGERASKIAVEVLERYYEKSVDQELQARLKTCVEEANSQIFTQARSTPTLQGMGTTLTFAILDKNSLNVGQIGDSRAYLIRNGTIKQLTADHSLVAEQLRMGLITEEEAALHPAKNVITRALGTKERVEPDFYSFQLETDDRLLLCSDGLHGVVDDPDLLRLTIQAGTPAEACIKLVEEANSKGGPDNITVIVVHVKPIKPFWKRLLRL